MLSLSTLGFVGGVVLVAGYVLYRAALPKPIPGIPYNKKSANRILGDVPDAMAYHGKTSELMKWIAEQAREFDTPVFQLFMRPFGKPWIITTDYREAQDIMVRRTTEFDRSDFFRDLFAEILPGNQVQMATGDPWRQHRRLMGDTMSPSFLNNVAAPQIYSTMMDTLELWDEKIRLAKGRSFDARHDIIRAALDVIWAATFGQQIGTTQSQTKLLSSLNQIELPPGGDLAAKFPLAPNPAAFDSLMTLSDSIEIAMNSPVPRLHHRFVLKFWPSMINAAKHKNQLIKNGLNDAWKKFSAGVENDDEVKSALDLIVHREALMAKKEGRSADIDTIAIKDELFGFLIAGHETTATTVGWGFKLLTKNQAAQEQLRLALRDAFPRAAAAQDNPSVEEIVTADIPYLDATIEEIHRMGVTASVNVRVAKVDTDVLGYHVPKGTDVFFMANGPGYLSPPIPVDESKRSKSSQESKGKTGEWDVSDIGVFKPERWLIEGEKGHTEFDARAGPDMPFGAGSRGCFGRKLASLELKIIFALVCWNYELQQTPPELSGFEAADKITHQPQHVYVRLAKAKC